jgi:hypothetical protein
VKSPFLLVKPANLNGKSCEITSFSGEITFFLTQKNAYRPSLGDDLDQGLT